MRVAVLYSGGKDSNFALFEALKFHEIVCIISLKSSNPHSYMFQSPGINFTEVQAEVLEIPQIIYETAGEKESELEDLKKAISQAKKKFKIEGIVSGAINSVYQSTRIQKICKDLDLWCFNPLWQKNQEKFLHELIENKFKVMIVGIASYPLNSSFLGRILDIKLINELIAIQKKYQINPAGEGGEMETFVLDAPMFKKEIRILQSHAKMNSENSGELIIEKVKLIKK